MQLLSLSQTFRKILGPFGIKFFTCLLEALDSGHNKAYIISLVYLETFAQLGIGLTLIIVSLSHRSGRASWQFYWELRVQIA